MPMRTDIRPSDWDYKTVLAVKEATDLCIAGNQMFGWILIDVIPPPPGSNEQMLTFGRESIPNESLDMVRLNKRLDSYVVQINTFNRLRTWAAFRIAAPMSMIGVGLLGAGMRALLFGRIGIAMLLIASGITHLLLTRFIYKTVQARKDSEMNDLIVQKRKEIEEVMERVQWMQKNDL